MSEIGQNGYLSQVSQINNRVSNFRGEQQNVDISRKSLNLQAKSEADMDDLRKVASGFGEQALKGMISKYANKVAGATWKKGGRSLNEIDKGFGKSLGLTEEEGLDTIPKVLGRGVEKVFGKSAGGAINSAAGKVSDLLGDAKEGLSNVSSFGENNIKTILADNTPNVQAGQRRITSVEELVAEKPPAPSAPQEVEMSDIRGNVQKQTTMGEPDQEDVRLGTDENVSPEEFQDHLDSKYNFSSAGNDAENVGADLLEDGAKTVGEEAITTGASTALEGVGAGLMATGVLAPLGALFEVLGFAGDVYAGVQGAEGVVNAFSNDVLGQHNYTTPKIEDPTAPKTLLQKGLLITPTTTTIHQQGTSLATGW